MRAAATNAGSNTAAAATLTPEQLSQLEGQTFLTAGDVADTPVSELGTESAEPRFTEDQFNALNKMDEVNETIRKYTDPGNVNSRYFFADEKADEARAEKEQLVLENPFLSTINRASENTGVNVGSNIGVIPPAPLMGSDYPAGYSTMVKQVESQVGQRPPQLGSSTPQPYNPQIFMRPQFPPLPPQSLRREPPAPPYVAPVIPTRPPTPQTPATPYNPFGQQTNPFRQETNPFFIPR